MVLSVADATHLTLAVNYGGSTASGLAYSTVKTSAAWGTNREIAVETAELIQQLSLGAVGLEFDPTDTDLLATNVQAALEEIAQQLSLGAEGVEFDPTGTDLLATNVQDALEEIAAEIGGPSLPLGGAVGQALKKVSGADGDAGWFPSREVISANRTYYVSDAVGNDANDGLATGTGRAFKTILKAWQVVCALDLNTYTATIQIADGTYTAGIDGTTLSPFGGNVIIRGNNTTPANVHLNVAGNCFLFTGSLAAYVQILDLKMSASGSGRGIWLTAPGVVGFGNVDFGTCATSHIQASSNGAFIKAVSNYAITGGASAHISARDLGRVEVESVTTTLTGTPAFVNAYAVVDRGGSYLCRSMTFTGSVTGKRFLVASSGIIFSNTNNLSYLPGNAAGTWESGGTFDGLMNAGPATTTDNTLPRFDGVNGLLQATGVVVDDNNYMSNVNGLQAVSTAQFGPQIIVDSEYNGAQAAYIYFQKGRNYGPIQNGDDLGTFIAAGRDSANQMTNSAFFTFQATSAPGAGSVNSKIAFLTTQSAAIAQRMALQSGLLMGAATGGDKGTGTINATDVYNDNVALTCMALASEFLSSGFVDTDFWDSLVPPTVVPELRHSVPYCEDRLVQETVVEKTEGGFMTRVVSMVRPEQVVDLMPVWDEDGNGVGVVEVPAVEEVVVPEQVIPRRHELAHCFKAMIEDGFDPRDPVAYINKLKADEALPGMLTKAEWQHGDHSTGELFGRLWLATEMLALVVINLHDRLSALESSAA